MKEVKGQFITIDGERFYEIANYDAMQPFFISLASDTDLWMYLSSTGGLTCGRRSPDFALFPYYTDDKITQNYPFTGARTLVRVPANDTMLVWEPFSINNDAVFRIERRICKSVTGATILFEETNQTLGLRIRYSWKSADRYGWVRSVWMENIAPKPQAFELIDGLQNILPAGVNRQTQNVYSTLVDGYKKTERIAGTPLVLYRMEAIMVDKAEPSESLTCNTVYTIGADDFDILTSSQQLDAFRHGGAILPEPESKGVQGAYLLYQAIKMEANESREWMFIADVEKDAADVHALLRDIARPHHKQDVLEALRATSENLRAIVARNDGEQHTGDEANDARHFANVLFNTMRGGYYLTYPPQSATQDLPLTFGRRHGDPSRPWNNFDIRVKDKDGKPIVAYQGNWRDIFQNWEALSVSYPLFINHIIAKFLNATTADGYNPYKVTNEGFEWEVINPDDPWSNIGYWGDHQIIYLLKLLELSYNHQPEVLRGLLNERQYAFANVPYRLKSYAEIVADPKNSIRFDDELHNRIMALVPKMGADAKLILDEHQQVRRTTMADKLLITLLTKLSNFIPNAGIWMNTLRPEWNDANNALVGYGASMVTLCYMRRYVTFLQTLIQEDITIGVETADFLHAIRHAYPNGNLKQFTDIVGTAGENYRNRVYAGISGETQEMELAEIQEFLSATLHKIDESIRANKREDGLYEAYNLIKFTTGDIEISHLYPMLEGQVAVLTSGILSGEESADLLDAMRQSALYREDQRSYMLYPNRRRPSFLEMNNLPEEAKQLPVVQKYLGTILKQDCDGGIHFDAQYRNANNLPEELKDLYESVFHHHAFTGRSGTFYKYEGLGCIYWHMVSKLLLAVGETIEVERRKTATLKEKSPALSRLEVHYRTIRDGIGSHKTPGEYGAFPFDAYSHTPSMAGAQQPGMTGQVKEDIISRFFELGVSVQDGQVTFCPTMLTDADFINGELRFTYCGTEIIYSRKSKDRFAQREKTGLTLTKEESAHLFARDGKIKQLIIEV